MTIVTLQMIQQLIFDPDIVQYGLSLLRLQVRIFTYEKKSESLSYYIHLTFNEEFVVAFSLF